MILLNYSGEGLWCFVIIDGVLLNVLLGLCELY